MGGMPVPRVTTSHRPRGTPFSLVSVTSGLQEPHDLSLFKLESDLRGQRRRQAQALSS